jgi:hypothetical protein
MFSVITIIFNKKTKWSALMELFTDTRKRKYLFYQLEMSDVRQELEYRINVCRVTPG